MNRKLTGEAALGVALIVALSCSERGITGTDGHSTDDSFGSEARIATVMVNFKSISIAVGDTTRAFATLRNRQDRPLTRTVSWTSSNPNVATVDGGGVVTGIGEGSATISATAGSALGSATIRVGTSVSALASATTDPGTVADLAVVSTDSSSVTVSFTQVDDGTGQPAKYDVRWAVAPISWGSAASTQNGSCTTPVTGTAIGTALSCTVAALVPNTEYNFQLVSFRGTLNQDAVFGGLSNIVAATTTTTSSLPAPVATVAVSPASAAVQVGSTVQLTAITKDANGNVLTGRTITWTSTDNNIATVSTAGRVTGVTAGSTQITATSEGQFANSAITVTAGPPPTSTNPGTITNLGVSSIDSNGVVLSFTQVDDGTGQPAKYDVRYAIAPISWGSAASVTSGTCTTPLAGFAIGATLSCRVGGLRSVTKYNFQLVAFRGTLDQDAVFGGLSNIAVATTTTAASGQTPVASVSVAPANASVGVGSTLQLAATTRDASNNILTGRIVTWTTSNSAVATVSTSGVVTGVAVGTAQVTATSEGASGTAAVSVTTASPPGTVTNLGVSAIDSNAVVLSFTQVDDGTGHPASYEMRYSSPPIMWGVATATTSGTCQTPISGTAIGTALICKVLGLKSGTKYDFQVAAFRGTLNLNAVFGSLSNVVSLTTTTSAPPPPVPVASVSVTLASSSIIVGQSTQATATTRDANGNALTGRAISWSSGNPAVATVSASGLVTALAGGTTQITATSESQVGSATLTVSAPPPPPPPPPGSSNEPAGMTLIDERPFNSLNEHAAPYSPAWDTDSDPTYITIVQDATAPKSPSNVLRFIYPTGMAGGGGNAPTHAGVQFTGRRVLYLAYWAKYSTNWWGHVTGVNKHCYVWANGTPVFVMESSGVGSGPLGLQMAIQGSPNSDGWYRPNLVPNVTINRGEWFKMEYVIVGNSAGTADGTMDYWLNGVHVGSYTGLQYTSAATSWDIYSLEPIWGGVGDVVPATMTWDVDHVYISGKN